MSLPLSLEGRDLESTVSGEWTGEMGGGCLVACLACMAIYARELNTVEIALAAIDEIDKVQFVAHINSLPDEILKNAEYLVLEKSESIMSSVVLVVVVVVSLHHCFFFKYAIYFNVFRNPSFFYFCTSCNCFLYFL